MKPYYEEAGIVIYHGDCREVLAGLGRVDHVITDPPYSEHVHDKYRTNPGYDSSHLHLAAGNRFDFGPADDLIRAAIAVVEPRRWTLVFSDLESTHLWRAALTPKLDYVRIGIWRKLYGAPQFTGDRPAVGCEAVNIFHRKGKKSWNGGGHQAFWEYPIVLEQRDGPRTHPTQKPLPLMHKLVEQFTDLGDLILDPFMGSGTTLRAAKDLGRCAIGIEIEEKYCEIAAKRLSQGVLFGAAGVDTSRRVG